MPHIQPFRRNRWKWSTGKEQGNNSKYRFIGTDSLYTWSFPKQPMHLFGLYNKNGIQFFQLASVHYFTWVYVPNYGSYAPLNYKISWEETTVEEISYRSFTYNNYNMTSIYHQTIKTFTYFKYIAMLNKTMTFWWGNICAHFGLQGFQRVQTRQSSVVFTIYYNMQFNILK
jgi:hypothetical protein